MNTPPLNRVVVGVDFAAPSVAAATWAAQWLVPDAELVLVHVLEPTQCSDGSPTQEVPRSTATLEYDRAERRLRELRRELTADFVWCEVREGGAADAILAVASEFRVDLVVLGAPAVSGMAREARDATVQQLVRRSETPVIIAGGTASRHPHRILVLVDDVTQPSAAVRCGRAIGAPFEAEVAVRTFETDDLPEADLIVVGHRSPPRVVAERSGDSGAAALMEGLRGLPRPVVFVPEPAHAGEVRSLRGLRGIVPSELTARPEPPELTGMAASGRVNPTSVFGSSGVGSSLPDRRAGWGNTPANERRA